MDGSVAQSKPPSLICYRSGDAKCTTNYVFMNNRCQYYQAAEPPRAIPGPRVSSLVEWFGLKPFLVLILFNLLKLRKVHITHTKHVITAVSGLRNVVLKVSHKILRNSSHLK